MLFGDLNKIVNSFEKLGGRDIWNIRLFLKIFMQELGAIDLGFTGCRFAWEIRQEGIASIKERIDRAIADKGWLNLFPTVTIEHLRREHFDHCPILINTEKEHKWGRRPFRFLEAWTTEKSCTQIVQTTWNMDLKNMRANHKLSRSLDFTISALKKWSTEVFGFAQTRIQTLEKELETLQTRGIDIKWKEKEIMDKLNLQMSI